SLAHHLEWPLARTCDLMLQSKAHVVPDTGYIPEFWGSWGLNAATWSAFDIGPLLLLRYEDLIADPGAQFRKLLGFLGWTDADDAIDAAVAATSFKTLQNAERESGFAEAPEGRRFFRRGVAGGWREHPDQEPFRRIEDAFADQMVRHGYA
ncbi:MAG: sulfotransferase domain-containing protein, partial [Pseudomonadota bacterium]